MESYTRTLGKPTAATGVPGAGAGGGEAGAGVCGGGETGDAGTGAGGTIGELGTGAGGTVGGGGLEPAQSSGVLVVSNKYELNIKSPCHLPAQLSVLLRPLSTRLRSTSPQACK